MVAAGEPADVAGEADEVAGDDRADTEQVGQRGLGRRDRGADAPVRLLELGVEALHFGQQFHGEVAAGLFDRRRRLDRRQEPRRRRKR